ncbi:MAG: ABC transporter permease [Bryobacteraceae bacterium]|nr:ABC transporter permease [Bryobacteraceae bacterium]
MRIQDLKQSFRTLLKTPGFTAVAILSLAMGIGLTTALFSLVDAVLLRPLPFPEAQQLMWLDESREGKPSGGNPQRLHDWQQASSLHAAGGFYGEGAVLLGQGDPVRLQVLRTMGPVLDVLGVRPVLGRGPTIAEQNGEGEAVALLSHATWLRRFNGNPQILAQSLNLGGTLVRVIGILPPDATYPEDVDVWTAAPREIQQTQRSAGFLAQVARLKAGVSLQQAQSELRAMQGRLALQYADTDKGRDVRLTPLLDHITEETRPALLLLFGTVAAVLLVACVNIAGLMLARGMARRREVGVRLALGASRWRVASLFLSESVVVSIAGGALGLLVAAYALAGLKLVLPAEVPRLTTAQIDWRVAGFALLLAVLTSLLSGFIPALHLSRQTVAGSVRQGGAANSGAVRGQGRLGSLLVVAQVAVTAVLMVGAGLLASSFLKLRQAPLGFQPENVLTFQVKLPWGAKEPEIQRVARETLARVGSLPGVRAAGAVDRLPLNGGTQSGQVQVNGADLSPALQQVEAGWRTATDGYFAAAGIAVAAGDLREFRGRSALVNQTFARTFFGEANPIGREIASAPRRPRPGQKVSWFRIVGVVADIRANPTERPMAEAYVPWTETYWPLLAFAVRSDVDAGTLAAAVRRAVKEVDPNQVVEDVKPLETYVAEASSSARVRAGLMGSFSLFGLLLAAIGLYGLLATEVTRRIPEYGVRLALGALPSSLSAAAMRRGLRLAGFGLAFGVALAVALSRVVQGLLFGVDPQDPVTIAAAAVLLLMVAAVACWLPARRAAKVDPIIALRHE